MCIWRRDIAFELVHDENSTRAVSDRILEAMQAAEEEADVTGVQHESKDVAMEDRQDDGEEGDADSEATVEAASLEAASLEAHRQQQGGSVTAIEEAEDMSELGEPPPLVECDDDDSDLDAKSVSSDNDEESESDEEDAGANDGGGAPLEDSEEEISEGEPEVEVNPAVPLPAKLLTGACPMVPHDDETFKLVQDANGASHLIHRGTGEMKKLEPSTASLYYLSLSLSLSLSMLSMYVYLSLSG